MPLKKTEGAVAATKAKAGSAHASYQDMIIDAIVNLKDRNGSSRQSLKKYVKANNILNVSDNMFDALFNKALKAGVDKGLFAQPKGPSGGTKLAKKKPEHKKVAVTAKKDKDTTIKKDTTKKATATTPKKAAAPKKSTTTKKTATPKKVTAKKTKETPSKAEKPSTVLTKTKSGRVAKAQKPASAKSRKVAPKKAATPKREKAVPVAATA